MDWLINGLKWIWDKITSVNQQQTMLDNQIRETQNKIISGDKETLNELGEQIDEVGQSMGKDSVISEGIGNAISEAGKGIQDLTGANEEYKVGEATGTTAPSSNDNWQKYVDQVEEWRQEDFARDDTKFQRQVKDMRAAGINPNLALGALGGNTAGNTNITAPQNTELEAELNEKLTLMQQFIDNEFKADENQKDRFTDLLGGIVNIFLAKKLFK